MPCAAPQAGWWARAGSATFPPPRASSNSPPLARGRAAGGLVGGNHPAGPLSDELGLCYPGT